MNELAVIGEPGFTLGFALSGIRKIRNAENPQKDVASLLSDRSVGIVAIDEATMSRLDQRTRNDVIASIQPVFVVVSERAAQEELRKMIIRSIGVDLLKE